MTPEELATHFERIRCSQCQIQLAVYRTRMAAAYHVAKARDMVSDNERAQALTGIDDIEKLRAQLPALIDRIAQLNDLADAAWADRARNADKLIDYTSQLAAAYDAIHLHPRVYERLARQGDKPLLTDAQAALDLPCDAPTRIVIERFRPRDAEGFAREVERSAH